MARVITEEEAEQLVADSLVLQELINSGLVDADTAAEVQLSINPEPWFAAHEEQEV